MKSILQPKIGKQIALRVKSLRRSELFNRIDSKLPLTRTPTARLFLTVATAVLGVLPATLVFILILFVFLGMLESLLSPPLEPFETFEAIAGTAALFALAATGYVSLWLVLRRPLNLVLALGLCAGLVSAGIGALWLWDENYFSNWALCYLFGGPMLVAAYHLLSYANPRI